MKKVVSTPYIYFMWLCGGLLYFYQFFLRTSPNVLSESLKDCFCITTSELTVLISLFYFAYAPMQIIVGILIDRFGSRRTLSCAGILCAFGTFLFISEDVNLARLGRFLIGAGAAFALPGTLKIISMWMPAKYLSKLTGITVSIGVLGAISAAAPLAAINKMYGWHATLYGTAILGIIISLILIIVVRDNPKSFEKYEGQSLQSNFDIIFKNLLQIVKNKQMWVLALYGLFLYAPLSVFADCHSVTFLQKKLLITRTKAAFLCPSIFYFGVMSGATGMAVIYDYLGASRILMMTCSSTVLVSMSLVLYYPITSIFLMGTLLFIIGFFASSIVLVFIFCNFIMPQSSRATGYGFLNMCQMASGVVLPFISAKIMGYYNYSYGICEDATLTSYQFGLSIIVVCAALGVILSYIAPEYKATDSK